LVKFRQETRGKRNKMLEELLDEGRDPNKGDRSQKAEKREGRSLGRAGRPREGRGGRPCIGGERRE